MKKENKLNKKIKTKKGKSKVKMLTDPVTWPD